MNPEWYKPDPTMSSFDAKKEYKLVDCAFLADVEAKFNELGQEAWELVTIADHVAYFIRYVPPSIDIKEGP